MPPISLVNAHLFRSAEERARSLQSAADNAQLAEKINNDILQAVRKQRRGRSKSAAAALGNLGKDPTARWRADQRQLLAAINDQLDALRLLGASITPTVSSPSTLKAAQSNLNDVIRQTVRQHAALLPRRAGFRSARSFPPKVSWLRWTPGLVGQVLDGLMSHTLCYSVNGGQVVIRLEKTSTSRPTSLSGCGRGDGCQGSGTRPG